jgi:hypothetical protein
MFEFAFSMASVSVQELLTLSRVGANEQDAGDKHEPC